MTTDTRHETLVDTRRKFLDHDAEARLIRLELAQVRAENAALLRRVADLEAEAAALRRAQLTVHLDDVFDRR